MKTCFRQAGFTLQELVTAIAIIGILMAFAVPSFMDAMDRAWVKGAAEQLFADLQYTKSESIKRSAVVTLTATGGSPWSYTITTPDGTLLKTVSGADFRGTSLDNNASIGFNPVRGTTSATTLTFSGSGSLIVNVVISSLGRIRIECQTAGGSAKGC